jgi:hypothetical protein
MIIGGVGINPDSLKTQIYQSILLSIIIRPAPPPVRRALFRKSLLGV